MEAPPALPGPAAASPAEALDAARREAFRTAFERLEATLVAARRRYEQVKALDDALFGDEMEVG